MGDNSFQPRRIDGFDAICAALRVGGARADAIALWTVENLARHVDRDALLAGENPPEPPYWAHLWSGARVLAAAIPRDAGAAVELGCGLGLPGVVAARRGARVTFVDRVATPLRFARASMAANGLAAAGFVVADFTGAALRGQWDLVLAAEVLYDRAAFPTVAATLAARLRPGGLALLADAARIDTRAFWPHLEAVGLRATIGEHRVVEEGFPVIVRLAALRHA
ncbi:MAG: class I SAM-dependent methyltransferase [bacterium]|nr:class I SAM-dependent methyltransferase [bacterium]